MKELQDNYTGLKRQKHIEKLIENQNVKISRVGRTYASAHSQIMQNYLQKMKLKPDTLVFSFRSGDDYIKRAFLRRGYHENSVRSSNLYDIKWEYTDGQTDYNTLR